MMLSSLNDFSCFKVVMEPHSTFSNPLMLNLAVKNQTFMIY